MPSVDGIISGIDTTSIVNQLLNAARAPIRGLQSQIDLLSTRKTKLQELNTLLGDLKTALGTVDGSGELPSYSANSSQPDALGVTVTGDVTPNSYDVRVDRLAESTLKRSQGFSSTDQNLRRGDLKITVDSQTVNVPLETSEGTRTPQGLADYINENVDGVRAYILNTGSGSTPYRLMIEGEQTGAAHQVTTSISFHGGGGTKLSLSTQRNAVDAKLNIEGLTVYNESNTPDDILPGIQFDLKGLTSGFAKVTVGYDPTEMATKAESVVTAYNALTEYFAKNIGIDANAAIQGDQTVRTIQRRLQSVLSAGYGNSEIAGLNSIGIGTAQDGTLEFDSAAFTSKAGSNFEALVDMLTGSDGLFGAMYDQVDTVIDPSTGIIQPRLDSIDTQVDSLNDNIDDAEYRLEIYEATIRSQFTAMEGLLAQYQATGDYLAAQLLQLNTQSN
jgi:flagellar hook-associated protein 2